MEKEVQVAAGQVLVEMHVTDWAAAQKEDPKLDAVLQWLESEKKTDLRTLLGRVYNKQRGLDGVEKPPEFHYPLRYPLLILHPKSGE